MVYTLNEDGWLVGFGSARSSLAKNKWQMCHFSFKTKVSKLSGIICL